MKLDQAVVTALRPAIREAWNSIAHDVYDMCEGDNECAMEMTFDADRLQTVQPLHGAKAQELVRALAVEHGYGKLLTFLSKNIQLL